MTTPIKRFLQNAHRRPEDEPVYYDAPPRGLQPPEFIRTTDYRENLVNLVVFYSSYVLMLASAAVVIYFSLRRESSFDQTFDVQAFPDVVFAWNADRAVTALPTISAPGSGGQASCTPYRWSRGLRLEYDCTSLAADATERLFFSLYSTTPYPATTKTYRDSRLRYSDIEVPTYYVSYSTYIPTTTANVNAAASTPSIPAGPSAIGISAPSAVQLAADIAATVTPAPALMRKRQESSAAQSTITASPTPTSLPLRKLEYPSSSLSALAAGTIVSTMATPSPTTTSIVVSTAKLKPSFNIFFIVAAVLPVVFASLTTLLVSCNLMIATKKEWPPRQSRPSPLTAEQRVELAAETRKATKRKKDESALSKKLDRPARKATGPRAGAKGQRTVSSGGGDVFRQLGRGAQPEPSEAAPPAYQEQDDSVQHVAAWLAQPRATQNEVDAIEVASISTVSSDSNATANFADQLAIDTAPSFDHVRVDPRIVLPTRTDGGRLPLRLAWFILPSYTYIYMWDMLSFVVLLVAVISAVGLAGDAAMDVSTFVRSGGCLGEPADKDSVYDLQRHLCSNNRFLSAYPVAYSNPTTKATLTKVGGDVLALSIGLVVLFLAYLTWVTALLRKSHLTHRDGMEPRGNDEGKRITGRTRWRYFTVWNKVGTHGWPYAEATELEARSP
ncbi:hypothetical protein PSEUBRA_004670 [Kalmanozyma brasiliensis GHG001]|uniref:uncharacterized protein n=1 Tax=Kalmanozyma brasiliensis (strain GHG001) TaxID=1365824 RepID=UPI0028683824|nr:uncharacterized protein PSEUBRA_004670 [Kalmanozyma brasiliensis GHG001]KAF6767406.1 hypothetical protein PSEUBRA_004670 [Kalmanozyma brasiliensis GHG001]